MISWTLRGVEYILDDETYCYFIGHSGFGMPGISRIEERSPMQDGITDLGFRLEARTLILVLAIKGKTPEEFYTKRSNLINMFVPSNIAGTVKLSVGSITREISGHVVSGLEFDLSDNNPLYQKAAVAIRCGNPTWYDPNGKAVTFNLGGGEGTGIIPMEVPYTVGASELNITKSIVYAGNFKTFPIIRIYGAITNPRIVHQQTGYELSFPGVSIGSGDYYEIDTRFGYKTVKDQDGVSKIFELSNESDLTLFTIGSKPEIADGVNTFTVTGSAVDILTTVEIVYYDRYIAI